MSATKTVLCVGINPAKRDTEETNSASLSMEIQQMINKQVSNAKDAGYDLHMEFIAPDEMDVKIPQIRALLQEKAWDGYIVGGGIRKEFSLTKYFEMLVNAGRELRPETRMGFNTTPMDIVVTMNRMFQR